MKWIIIGTLCVCGAAGLLWMIGKWVEKKYTFNPPAPIPIATSTSPTPPPSLPAPTPTPAAKSHGWLWLIVGIISAIIVYYAVLPALRTSAPSPKPQIQQFQPQRQERSFPQKYTKVVWLDEERSRGLTLVSKTPRGDTHFVVTSNGKAFLLTEVTVDTKGGTAYFKSFISRNYPGTIHLEVNGMTLPAFHKGGGRTGIIFNFPAQNLSLGKNTFFLSSPGEDIFVEKIEVEIQY